MMQLPCQLTSYVTKGVLSKIGIFIISERLFILTLSTVKFLETELSLSFTISSHSPFAIPQTVLVLKKDNDSALKKYRP